VSDSPEHIRDLINKFLNLSQKAHYVIINPLTFKSIYPMGLTYNDIPAHIVENKHVKTNCIYITCSDLGEFMDLNNYYIGGNKCSEKIGVSIDKSAVSKIYIDNTNITPLRRIL
jgi:hypothetical protein